MALPKQVQQHLKDLEAYEQQLAAQSPQDSEPTEQPADEAPPDNVVTLEQPGVDATADEAASDQTEPAPTQDAPAPVAEADDPAKWESRYKHLEGKYRAEVPRLHNEIKELRSAIEQMQKAQAEAPTTPTRAPEPAKSLITEQDVDAFGEDLIDLQRRVVKEMIAGDVQRELDKMRKENEALRGQFTKVQGNAFEVRLRQSIPDFDVVNQDPQWIAWLDEVDPLLRAPRRVVAQQAWNAEDVAAVKAYIDMYKQSVSPSTKPAASQRQAELKRQVQPTKATNSGSGPNTAGVKRYTTQEADEAFKQVQKLMISGRQSEAEALENEISAAYIEGRVSG